MPHRLQFFPPHDCEDRDKLSMIRIIEYPQLSMIPLSKNMLQSKVSYRENFPHATVHPKMHIIEDHMVPWLKRWRLGSGLMGEQGTESIHAHLMKLERTHQGIPNELDCFRYIVKECMLESDPSLTTCLTAAVIQRGSLHVVAVFYPVF